MSTRPRLVPSTQTSIMPPAGPTQPVTTTPLPATVTDAAVCDRMVGVLVRKPPPTLR